MSRLVQCGDSAWTVQDSVGQYGNSAGTVKDSPDSAGHCRDSAGTARVQCIHNVETLQRQERDQGPKQKSRLGSSS